jgi:hypothetical protein
MMPISRRAALKGLGVSVALPFLEAMTPSSLLAAAPRRRPVQAAMQGATTRMAFCYVPNGVNMREWQPTVEGTTLTLPKTLEPLSPYKDDLLVLSGLTVDKARPNGDGPGDHARAMSAFLTGSQPRKTSGADIRVGISVDQLAAVRIGSATRFPSLEIGCEGGRLAGNCDSGYSCAYSSNLSWRSESTPQPKEINPRAVFDRLFASHVRGETNQNQGLRDHFNRSILDFVREDAAALRMRLGSADLRRLDEYLTSIREIEQRLDRTAVTPAPHLTGGMRRPLAVPADYGEYLRVMSDLLVLAFQGDVTRIATFVFANEGSNRSYRHINISDGHHDLSHHGRNPEKLDKIARINRFHVEQFAYLVGKLKDTREGNGSLLDSCMLVYGSGNGDGNRHNHDDLPILLVGKGGGTITTGRHVRYPRNTPIANLYLEMLDRMGVREQRFGDSSGRLPQLRA